MSVYQERNVERTSPVDPEVVDEVHATAYDPYAYRRQSAVKLVQAVSLIFGVVEALLALRFILKLLGANPNADFGAFIYNVTAPLVAPFVGLFGTPQAGGSTLELHSLVALVVYALLAWLVTRLVWLAFGETRSATTTTSDGARARVR